MSPAQYLRNRAEQHRQRATDGTLNEAEQAEWRHSARHLDIVADEIEAEFHVNDDED